MKKILGDMRMDLAGICKMSGNCSSFFPVTMHFLKLPKLIFYRFWAKISPTEKNMTFSGQKVLKTSLESGFEFPLSNSQELRVKKFLKGFAHKGLKSRCEPLMPKVHKQKISRFDSARK